VRVVHEAGDAIDSGECRRRTLASDVEVAESTVEQARGLMFRSSIPDGSALVLDVGGGLLTSGPSRQFVHMLFVRFPLDVLWLRNDVVVKNARLAPWRGFGVARADCVLELPAGGADGVDVGDTVRVVDGPSGREP
jgi:uncharacterized membrane protein (UPF0127 family)